MSLRGLNSVAIDVRNVDETALYYRDFRRASRTDGTVSFRPDTGGQQLKLVHAHRRGLVRLRIGDDDRIACQLRRMNISVSTPTTLQVRHPGALTCGLAQGERHGQAGFGQHAAHQSALRG